MAFTAVERAQDCSHSTLHDLNPVSLFRWFPVLYSADTWRSAFIASIYRTHIVQTHNANYLTPSESSLWISWMVGETGIYLIVACLPGLAPLFKLVLPRRLRRDPPRLQVDSEHNYGQRGARGDFTRLVEHDATAQSLSPQEAARQKAGLTPAAIELGERARTPGGGPKVDDLLGMQAGRGVLVHTEVIVTEEEKVANVIGI